MFCWMHFVEFPEVWLIYLRQALLICPVCHNNFRGHICLCLEWVSINKPQAGGAVSKVKPVENSTTAQSTLMYCTKMKMKGRWKRDWGMSRSRSTWWKGWRWSGFSKISAARVTLTHLPYLNTLSKPPVHHSLIQFVWFKSVSLSNRPSSFYRLE